MNGKAKSSVFDLLWDELKLYLDETTQAVDERRHGEVMHMPFAISIRYLCDLITERLNKKYTNPAPPIPFSRVDSPSILAIQSIL